MVIFQLEPLDAQLYRQQTRRSTFIVAATFVPLAVGLAALAVALFGEPGADNLRWNVLGVVLGLLATAALVRFVYLKQRWMASAAYGWRLKRSLMRVTNVMHHVKVGVAAGDPEAMKLLRFYHVGLTQMHELDGNSASLGEVRAEIERHREAMEGRGLDIDQRSLDDAWLGSVKRFAAAR